MGPVLSSDGYVSKTRMKTKMCNNIAWQCKNVVPFTLSNIIEAPQRAIVHIGYNYQYLPDKI